MFHPAPSHFPEGLSKARVRGELALPSPQEKRPRRPGRLVGLLRKGVECFCFGFVGAW